MLMKKISSQMLLSLLCVITISACGPSNKSETSSAIKNPTDQTVAEETQHETTVKETTEAEISDDDAVDKMQGGWLSGFDGRVDDVRYGAPMWLPDITYGEAYENYFANSKWQAFDSTDGKSVVEYSGECTYNDKPAEVYIQFNLHNDDTFEFAYCSLAQDGKKIKADPSIIVQLLYNPFEEYAQNVLGTNIDEETQNMIINTYYEMLSEYETQSEYNNSTDIVNDTNNESVNADFNPTSHTYDNSTYDSASDFNSDEYIFPQSNARYLTDYEIYALTPEEARLAINEIAARYGRIFKDEELNKYFSSKSWYRGTLTREEYESLIKLTDVEEVNSQRLVARRDGKPLPTVDEILATLSHNGNWIGTFVSEDGQSIIVHAQDDKGISMTHTTYSEEGWYTDTYYVPFTNGVTEALYDQWRKYTKIDNDHIELTTVDIYGNYVESFADGTYTRQ